MSADSWLTCPVCSGHSEKYRNGIDHLYGKVSQEEYEKAKEDYIKEGLVETVSAYHELTTGSGHNLEWAISASCEKCGAKWEYQIKIPPKGGMK